MTLFCGDYFCGAVTLMSYFTRTVRAKTEIESEIRRNLLDARNESSAGRTCPTRETQNHEDKNILQNETHFVF